MVADSRNLLWKDVAAAMPAFDWEKGFDIEEELRDKLNDAGFKLPVNNQGVSGSCGGQAYSSLDGVIEAMSTGTFERRSAKYIIAQTYVLDDNGVMLGSRMGDNAKILKDQGVAREEVLSSYQGTNPPTDAFMNRRDDITEAARADAKTGKAKSHAFIMGGIDEYAQSIAINFGAVVLLRGENNGTWRTAFPKVTTDPDWGHYMYFGKPEFREGKKGIWGLQSWGEAVGEKGWQWFGEDWFESGFIEAGHTFIFDDAIIIPPKYKFTRDLTLGNSGVDVKFLQSFLNKNGFPVALFGPGSAGNETSYFGAYTKKALSEFQKAKGIYPAHGYFGPITRSKINLIN